MRKTCKTENCKKRFISKNNTKYCTSCRFFGTSFGKWFLYQLKEKPLESLPTVEELKELITHYKDMKKFQQMEFYNDNFSSYLKLDISHLCPSSSIKPFARVVASNYTLFPSTVNRSVKDVPITTSADNTTTGETKVTDWKATIVKTYGANLPLIIKEFSLKRTSTSLRDFECKRYSYLEYLCFFIKSMSKAMNMSKEQQIFLLKKVYCLYEAAYLIEYAKFNAEDCQQEDELFFSTLKTDYTHYFKEFFTLLHNNKEVCDYLDTAALKLSIKAPDLKINYCGLVTSRYSSRDLFKITSKEDNDY